MKKITILVADIIATAFIVIDLFCGAGGTTTGFVMTKGLAKVVACVNHDKKAIQSHWMNNPEVKHFEEDIRTLDLTDLTALVKKYRAIYPNAKVILWASLECTNFSKAKGGQPRDADSRTLADCLIRYIIALNPDIVQIENVVEFMSWGPLDKNGKPVSKHSGRDFIRWRKEICALGYSDEWKQLNSADFGAYTSRNRLFGMFAKDQSWITWPEPTHFKKPSTGDMFAAPKKWKPVKEVLDFSDEGNSVFSRKKDLSPKTYERIYAGLVKYIAGGDTSFIAKYFSGRPAGKVISTEGPAGTLTTAGNQSLISAVFMMQANSGNPAGKTYSLDRPSRTLTCTGGNQSIVQPKFLMNYHHSSDVNSIENPAGTILSIPKLNMIRVEKFILNQNSSTAPACNVNNPAPTITQRTHYLVNAKRFIMDTNYNNVGRDIESPAPVLTASRRYHYLVNPQWGTKGNSSVEKPCFTLIARMDKAPPYIVTTEEGDVAIQVFESDCEEIIKIKKFMAAYGIVDIKMRMLKVPELLKIQGFPDDYMLFGNQTDQKKFIGNSVVPLVVKCWIESIGNGMEKLAA